MNWLAFINFSICNKNSFISRLALEKQIAETPLSKIIIVLYLYTGFSPHHLIMKGFKYFLCLLLLMTSYCSSAQEICDNGKDDDGDGLVDLQDPDCQCHFNVPGNLLQNGSFESYNSCPTNYSYDCLLYTSPSPRD